MDFPGIFFENIAQFKNFIYLCSKIPIEQINEDISVLTLSAICPFSSQAKPPLQNYQRQ